MSSKKYVRQEAALKRELAKFSYKARAVAGQVDECPRCGGRPGEELDENGMPYTCFFCNHTGSVQRYESPSYPTGKYHRAECRMTYRYNADWSQNDDWNSPDSLFVKVISGQSFEDGDEFDSGYTHWQEVTFNKPVSRLLANAILRGMFARSCSCEHDCCGHYSGGVHEVRKASKNGRHWICSTHYSPNY